MYFSHAFLLLPTRWGSPWMEAIRVLKFPTRPSWGSGNWFCKGANGLTFWKVPSIPFVLSFKFYFSNSESCHCGGHSPYGFYCIHNLYFAQASFLYSRHHRLILFWLFHKSILEYGLMEVLSHNWTLSAFLRLDYHNFLPLPYYKLERFFHWYPFGCSCLLSTCMFTITFIKCFHNPMWFSTMLVP